MFLECGSDAQGLDAFVRVSRDLPAFNRPAPVQGRIQHVTVILAHAQVVGGGAVRTVVRTLQRELLGRCLPCGGALNLHNHLG